MTSLFKNLNLKKLQDSITDIAKISSLEINRGIKQTKNQIEKYHIVQKRKELFSELGRCLYEATEDGLPKQVKSYIESTELQEILQEIKILDLKLKEKIIANDE